MIDLPILHRNETYPLRTGKIIGIGLNYHDHLAEHDRLHGTRTPIPREPVLFAKTPNCLIPTGAPILLPQALSDYSFSNPRTDYEAEVAVIIKERCRHISSEEALAAVLGYTAMNDVSQRNWQKGDTSGWFRGKCLDTFAPIGPAILAAEDCPDPQNLSLQCHLNRREVQSSHTSQMIFPIKEIIAFISRFMTLEPGDIITTGTPSGVGPLTPGDRVEITIGGLGTLSNPVLREPSP